jgi:lipoate-protein ligase A
VEAVPGARQLSWSVEQHTGDARSFHALAPSPGAGARLAWVVSPSAAALVLGSAQRDDAVDRRVADALGIDIARRRSGGGAVLVVPGEMVWVDLLITSADPLWDADVGRSMHWVGAAWQAALSGLGVAGDVHRGALIRTAWSPAVCFAGTGAGEVIDRRGAKLVGIAQRRSRDWARFQTMCHLRWRPELVAALVSPPRPTAAELAEVTATVSAPPDVVIESLLSHLP